MLGISMTMMAINRMFIVVIKLSDHTIMYKY